MHKQLRSQSFSFTPARIVWRGVGARGDVSGDIEFTDAHQPRPEDVVRINAAIAADQPKPLWPEMLHRWLDGPQQAAARAEVQQLARSNRTLVHGLALRPDSIVMHPAQPLPVAETQPMSYVSPTDRIPGPNAGYRRLPPQ